jgi:hypothetical protein
MCIGGGGHSGISFSCGTPGGVAFWTGTLTSPATVTVGNGATTSTASGASSFGSYASAEGGVNAGVISSDAATNYQYSCGAFPNLRPPRGFGAGSYSTSNEYTNVNAVAGAVIVFL